MTSPLSCTASKSRFRPDGNPRLADTAMVALALLIAESEPKQKNLMIRLVLNLLDDEK